MCSIKLRKLLWSVHIIAHACIKACDWSIKEWRRDKSKVQASMGIHLRYFSGCRTKPPFRSKATAALLLPAASQSHLKKAPLCLNQYGRQLMSMGTLESAVASRVAMVELTFGYKAACFSRDCSYNDDSDALVTCRGVRQCSGVQPRQQCTGLLMIDCLYRGTPANFACLQHLKPSSLSA